MPSKTKTTTTILLLLAAASFGQDPAAKPDAKPTAPAIFYQAFWLETAEGKPDLAYTLYEQVLKQHPTSFEAPRAAVGMARIRANKGQDIAWIAAWVQKLHPYARLEIEAISRLSAARLQPFSSTVTAQDSPAMRKIKLLYGLLQRGQKLGIVSDPDTQFLVEAGALAHAMLSALLRLPDYNPVLSGATTLVRQKTAKAYAVLEDALSDPKVLFKTAIVHSLHAMEVDSPGIARALVKLYTTASPTLKETIVKTLARLTAVEGETRAIAFSLLSPALASDERDIRIAAAGPSADASLWPDAYVLARLDRMEKGDPVYGPAQYDQLLALAGRKGVSERALVLLSAQTLPGSDGRSYNLSTMRKLDSAGALLLAEAILAQRTRSRKPSIATTVQYVVGAGPQAARRLIEAALDRGDRELAFQVLAPQGRYVTTHAGVTHLGGKPVARHDARAYFGKAADAIVAKALEASFSNDDARRAAGSLVVAEMGLGPNGDKLLIEAIRANPKTPLPAFVFDARTLTAIGPRKMEAVAKLARTPADYNSFLRAGVAYAKTVQNREASTGFFRVVVPNVNESAVPYLKQVASFSGQVRILVADKLLKSPEWNWEARGPVYSVWNTHVKLAASSPQLRRFTLTLTNDARTSVAQEALQLAASENDVAALARGLGAPTYQLRLYAVGSLADRGAAGADALVSSLAWEKVTPIERKRALQAIARTKETRHVEFLREKLATRKALWAVAWEPYHVAAPAPAVDLALAEVFGQGEPDYRFGALRVLTNTSDKRRIGIFERVLKAGDQERTLLVAQTIADQYLIELGPQVLEQLRSPNAAIRQIATKAIERLKFYAEAKKTFEEDEEEKKK